MDSFYKNIKIKMMYKLQISLLKTRELKLG
jgi:hypothetical protein